MTQLSFPISNKPFRRSGSFVKSPFRYPGGKFYALTHILPFILCVPHDEYREPFMGGGSIFFAKPKASVNWVNDLESDIIKTYCVIADPQLRQELIARFSKEVASKERHLEIKQMKINSLLDLAFKTYYLNRTSYSGIINKPSWGYKDGKSSPPENWANFIDQSGKKLEEVNITSLDFEQVITAPSPSKKVLMYLDPPYYHADQKRAYTKPFSFEDHQRLAVSLKNTTHLFCLSYDDCEEIRLLYKWAEINEVSWLYNTANLNGIPRKLGKEIIITNYQVSSTIMEQICLL